MLAVPAKYLSSPIRLNPQQAAASDGYGTLTNSVTRNRRLLRSLSTWVAIRIADVLSEAGPIFDLTT
jgi:hypothetical protein